MLSREVYVAVRFKYFGEPRFIAKKNYKKYKRAKEVKPSEAIQFLEKAKVCWPRIKPKPLESCKKAAPIVNWSVVDDWDNCKQEGTTPMCYEKTGKSEAEISRAYLTNRLGDANYAKRDQLRKLFNLDAIAIPKTYKELIDAIKNGKYEIDAKVAKLIEISTEDEGQYYGSPLDGITFTDFPKPDYEGFTAASTEQQKKYTQTKDALFLPYEQGLKALADFEAWMPEGK